MIRIDRTILSVTVRKSFCSMASRRRHPTHWLSRGRVDGVDAAVRESACFVRAVAPSRRRRTIERSHVRNGTQVKVKKERLTGKAAAPARSRRRPAWGKEHN